MRLALTYPVQTTFLLVFSKISKFINGVEIVGTRHDIYSAAKKYAVDVIVFAIPSLGRNERREILDYYIEKNGYIIADNFEGQKETILNILKMEQELNILNRKHKGILNTLPF